MNKVLFLGRLVANPEYKINEKGTKISTFRLAINNGKNYEPLFINVTVFNNLADQCYKWLQKATLVFIDGRLEMRQAENGETYYSVISNQVTFLKGLKEVVENVTSIDNHE